MSSYSIATIFTDLSTQTTEFIEGMIAHEKSIGVTQNTAATIAADLATAEAANGAFEAIKEGRSTTLQPAYRKADEEGEQFIVRAKKVLTVHLGERWTEQWAEAGFADRSIRIPQSIGGREKVLKLLASYFKAHPSQESTDLKVSAKRAATLHAALVAARTAVENHPSRQKAARIGRDEAITALRKRLRATVAELDMLLKGDSPVWAAFGLIPPAVKNRRPSKKETAPAATSGTAARPATSANQGKVALAQ
jgi:hypothetical protein